MPHKKLALNCCLFTFICCLLFSAQPALAFKILEPAENASLKAGQPVTVKVDVGREAGIVSVKYFWYREMDETLVEQDAAKDGSDKGGMHLIEKYWQKDFVYGSNVVAVAALVATVDSKPPYGGLLMVPKGAIGTVRLLAIAEISRGRLGSPTVRSSSWSPNGNPWASTIPLPNSMSNPVWRKGAASLFLTTLTRTRLPTASAPSLSV